ncbi:hypothetical protein RvY_10481-2 [Ramazzottius varieornatus]|uniref:G-protein coupled receptors family 1 profile domain-containing protein n=1 Tax=Ramazzottius varieornatus TaxID=947166 RepID=A0A1D1VFB4_RAMVA|nr:hypothetical protein RvY_10481-2 [Ramazzottius varieornatus]
MSDKSTSGSQLDKAVDPDRPLWQYFWIAVTMALSLLAALLFIVLLLAVGRKRKLRAGAGILISNLLISELLLTAIFFPLSSIAIYHSLAYPKDYFLLSDAALDFVRISVIYSFHWNGAFLALNRYCAVLHPRFYQDKFSSRRLLFGLVVLTWLIGFTIAVPTYTKNVFEDTLWYEDLSPDYSSSNNSSSKDHRKSLSCIRNTFGAYIPAVLIGAIYCTLFCHIAVLYRDERRPPATSASSSASPPTESLVRQRRLAVAKMLFVSYWFFGVCFMTTPIIYSFFPSTFVRPEVQTWTRTLDVLGHTFNPVSRQKVRRHCGRLM